MEEEWISERDVLAQEDILYSGFEKGTVLRYPKTTVVCLISSAWCC